MPYFLPAYIKGSLIISLLKIINREHSKIINHVDVLKISSQEEVNLLFENDLDCIDYFKNLEKICLLTYGEKGSKIITNNKIINIPPFRTKTIDPTGAGDVYTATFGIKYAQNKELKSSGLFASCAASLVVEHPNIEKFPSLEEINKRLGKK